LIFALSLSLAELRVPANFSRIKKAPKVVVEELRRDKRVVEATAYLPPPPFD
jgi:hypothetical protein